jgi:hypothetical protein
MNFIHIGDLSLVAIPAKDRGASEHCQRQAPREERGVYAASLPTARELWNCVGSNLKLKRSAQMRDRAPGHCQDARNGRACRIRFRCFTSLP